MGRLFPGSCYADNCSITRPKPKFGRHIVPKDPKMPNLRVIGGKERKMRLAGLIFDEKSPEY
ncbi:hypothetical protein N7463_007917 [Penicillium fimorum]|uniref:Uncharacterized protein n=1 Tax=Penicillium fimorum TaxID=1882269 RepID=A0A9W9XXC4_9EURO|nr:hypothetical protein N7463_007917 [Penicillium fimorum]